MEVVVEEVQKQQYISEPGAWYTPAIKDALHKDYALNYLPAVESWHKKPSHIISHPDHAKAYLDNLSLPDDTNWQRNSHNTEFAYRKIIKQNIFLSKIGAILQVLPLFSH